MDIGSVLGLVIGFIFIVGSILASGTLGAFIDIPSLLVVCGGTVGAVIVRFPIPTIINSIKVISKAFFNQSPRSNETISEIVSLAETARKESILALEKVEINNDFLKKGVQMAVDGKDPETIKAVLNIELESLEERHKTGRGVVEGAAELAPAFGMIGTLIGLIVMLGSLDDPSSIGPAMAVALITTFYGAILANLVFIPLAGKLQARTNEEIVSRLIIITGVISILAGENPRVIKEKLESYLAPMMRTGDEDDKRE